MNDISDKKWMKFSLDNVSMRQMLMLDAIHSNAVSVWLRAFTIVKNNGGEMELRVLYQSLISRKLSRQKVLEILKATGDFEIDMTTNMIALSESAHKKMTSSSGKFPPAKPLAGGNFPEQNAANAHASSSTIQEREKENNLPSFACERPDWPEMPEELADYEQETWFDEVCTLFDQDQMEQWRDTLMMQHPDKELTGLMERHWAETVMQFVFHLVTWPPSKGIWSLNDMKRAFHNFVRDNRTPSRQLKALLRQLELQQTECDEREQRFHGYMQEHFPHLQQMPDALSFEQFDALRRHYGKAAVLTVLTDMENDTTLEKRSCYETARGWLGHRKRPPT